MHRMQPLLLALAFGRLLRQAPTVRTGVEPDVYLNAHPDQWQACAADDVCPLLDTVPHSCFENRGEMHVHPQCFHFACDLFACVTGQSTSDGPAPANAAEVCEPVREEIWSKVAQKGHDVDDFVQECSAGTFTCLMQCPELHSLLVDDDALNRCQGGEQSREYCKAWLARTQQCVRAHGECGASMFGRMAGVSAGVSAAVSTGTPADANATAADTNFTAANASNATGGNASSAPELPNLDELRDLTRQMDAVVRSAQEAFEATFMSACDPACERGEQCVHGKCIYRPFATRHTDKVGGVHPPAGWWPGWVKERPNHPQRDHWNPAVAASREPHRFGGL